jgi:hypothetical protein
MSGFSTTSWNPILSGSSAPYPEVHSILVEGANVLLAGNFTAYGGFMHQGIVEVDNATGFPTSWFMTTNGYVNALLPIGSTVFAGGDFNRINNTTTTGGLFTLNTSTHALSALSTQIGADVLAMAWNGNALEVGGAFISAGGLPDERYVALGGGFAGVGEGPAAGAGDALRLSTNPSRGPVTIGFTLPAPGVVELALYDLSGRRVRSEHWAGMTAGAQHVTWDGAEDDGHPAPAGVYLARIRAAGVELAVKLTRLR